MGVIIISEVPEGETERFIVITDGEELLVYGSAVETRILSGGIQYVESGGAAQAASLDNGGEEVVSSGGRDAQALIYSGGAIYDSGAVSYTTVSSGGALYVSGGTAYDAQVQGGLYVMAGGAASSSVISSGGADDVAGGLASLTTVLSGGAEQVLSGGIAYGTVVESAGGQYVTDGGSAAATTVLLGGLVEFGAGGTGSGMTVQQGGQALLFSGGTGYGTVVDRGGAEILSAGGSSQDTQVNAGGAEVVASGGTALNTSIASGGALVLLPGAVAEGTQAAAGGKVVVTGTVLVNPDSAVQIFAASAAGLTVREGGDLYVFSGGNAKSTVLTGGVNFAVMEVFAGGGATGTILNSGGELFVMSGGGEAGAVVASAGYLYASGLGLDDTLNAGGTMFVQSGGQSIGTQINGGARQFVGAGGEAALTTLAAEAVQLVSGGSAFGTDIGSGGSQYVDSGSTAAQTTVAGQEILSASAVGEGAEIAGGTLILSAGSEFTGAISFAGSGGVLEIHGTVPVAPIEGFAVGDSIILYALAYNAADVPDVPSAGTLVIAPGYSLNITDATASTEFQLLDDGGVTEVVTANVPCFAAGTRILTPEGEVEVELLRVGGHVITEAGEDAPIIWIGRRFMRLEAHPEPSAARPIRIAAHSFGLGQPVRDLLLSPDHAVLCGGVLVPAKALVNGANITQLKCRTVTYYHVELAEHSIIFAENLAVESYLDTGNRNGFESVAPGLPRGDAQAQAMRLRESCAPLAEAGALVLQARHMAARRYLRKRALF